MTRVWKIGRSPVQGIAITDFKLAQYQKTEIITMTENTFDRVLSYCMIRTQLPPTHNFTQKTDECGCKIP